MFAALVLALVAASPATAETVTIHRHERQHVYENTGIEVRMLVQNADGAYLGRLRFAPGVTVPAHRHPTSEELLTFLSGEGEMTLDGKPVRIHAGDAVHVPKNTLHDFRNTGTVPVEAIQVYTPKGPEERFRAWPRR